MFRRYDVEHPSVCGEEPQLLSMTTKTNEGRNGRASSHLLSLRRFL